MDYSILNMNATIIIMNFVFVFNPIKMFFRVSDSPTFAKDEHGNNTGKIIYLVEQHFIIRKMKR